MDTTVDPDENRIPNLVTVSKLKRDRKKKDEMQRIKRILANERKRNFKKPRGVT